MFDFYCYYSIYWFKVTKNTEKLNKNIRNLQLKFDQKQIVLRPTLISVCASGELSMSNLFIQWTTCWRFGSSFSCSMNEVTIAQWMNSTCWNKIIQGVKLFKGSKFFEGSSLFGCQNFCGQNFGWSRFWKLV